MKKHYTKPTAEPIALHFESSLLEDSGTEIKKHKQDLSDVKEFDEDEEVEWE